MLSMSNLHIDENTEIGNTGKYLKDIPFDFKNGKVINGLNYVMIGRWTNGYPIYLVHGKLGVLPNNTTQTYQFNLPNFYGYLLINFIADGGGNNRVNLPYIYPNTQYMNYWITIDIITNNRVQIITGIDRTNFSLYATFVVVLSKEI